jgi:hypothetical protein
LKDTGVGRDGLWIFFNDSKRVTACKTTGFREIWMFLVKLTSMTIRGGFKRDTYNFKVIHAL